MDKWPLPTIAIDRCTGCSLCVKYCPGKAVLMLKERPAFIHPQECSYCGICEDICPSGAIELTYQIMPLTSNKTAGQTHKRGLSNE